MIHIGKGRETEFPVNAFPNGVREIWASSRRRAGGGAAFTLFELMLVLAIMVVAAAISFPSLKSMVASYRVTAAGDSIRAAWAQGRAHAMNESRAYRFSIVVGAGDFRLAPDSSEYWSGKGSASPTPGAALILQDALRPGVRFSDPKQPGAANFADDSPSAVAPGSDSSDWSTVAVFLPDGTARDDCELTFSTKGARALSVKLRAMTGAVTTRWLAGS
jgi:Tfp pilus assembly protein FimT